MADPWSSETTRYAARSGRSVSEGAATCATRLPRLGALLGDARLRVTERVRGEPSGVLGYRLVQRLEPVRKWTPRPISGHLCNLDLQHEVREQLYLLPRRPRVDNESGDLGFFVDDWPFDAARPGDHRADRRLHRESALDDAGANEE